MTFILIRIFLAISIILSPIGQSVLANSNVMNSMSDDCIDCFHTMDNNESACIDGNCFPANCTPHLVPTFSAVSLTSTYFFLDIKGSNAVFDRYGKTHYSHISPPLIRPPIAI